MGPKNFAPIRPTGHKLRHFFEVTHGRTDGHKDKNESPQYHYRIFFLHVCEWEGGKLYKTYQISTSSLCEGLQFVMHDLELDSNFLTRYSLLNFALKFVFLVKVMNFLNFGKILLH